MWNSIPNSPADNPHVDPGIYEAVIDSLSEGTDGTAQPCVMIVLRLDDFDLYFVTKLGLPAGGVVRSEQRFWHFWAFAALEKDDACGRPELFVGKRLRVKVACMNRSGVNSGSNYFDVERFLPIKPVQQQSPTVEKRQDGMQHSCVSGNPADTRRGRESDAVCLPLGSGGIAHDGGNQRHRAVPARVVGAVPLPDQVRA
jgi:hypothetical protein